MDQSGSCRRWLQVIRGSRQKKTKTTIREMAIADRTTVSGTTVKARARAASCLSPHPAAEASTWVEDVNIATFHGSRHGFRRQRTGGQVGESTGSHGGDRRFQGLEQEGSSNSTGQDTDQRLRTISPPVGHVVRNAEVAGIGACAGYRSSTNDIGHSQVQARSIARRFCVEEMQQWAWNCQQDLQAATMAGRPEEVGKISQVIIQRAQEWHGNQSGPVRHTGPKHRRP